METNQTAVDKLLAELQAKFPNEMYAMYNSNQLEFESIVNDAKATHAIQIIESYNLGSWNRHEDYGKNGAEYYSKHFVATEGGEG